MRNTFVRCTLIGAGLLGLGFDTAFAQVRGSMIPSETLEVALQRTDRMFDRLDSDRDGIVTEADVAAMAQRAQGQDRQRAGAQGRGAGMMLLLFANADTNGDARITREEMRTSATTRFHDQDRNGDGVVSADERPAFPGRPGAGFGPPQTEIQMPPMGDPSGD